MAAPALKERDESSVMASEEGDGGNSAAAPSPAALAPPAKEHLSENPPVPSPAAPAPLPPSPAAPASLAPMRSPMISEMQRINALNLEPSSNAKASASRYASSNAQGNDLKMEFQRSALEIRARQDQATRQKQEKEAGKGAADGDGKRGGQAPATNQGGADNARKSDAKVGNKSFNPSAAAFNQNAPVFTPGVGAATAAPAQAPAAPKQTPPQAQVSPKAPSNSPSFSTFASSPELQSRSLERILDLCFGPCEGENLAGHTPDWPEAQGASYHDVLGQPKQMPQNMQGPQGGAMVGPWQQQGQFGMAPMPGGQAAMGYPQMCPQMQQRPQNAGGGPPQQAQGQGMMGFQPQMMQGGQGMMPAGQGMMGFQPQMMGFQPQMVQGGQGGQAMMVPMMMPAGQHPGNFAVPPQGGGNPQQAQAQMMQQMHRQQMGSGGPRASKNDRS